jgi:hypothetical protein
MSPADARRRPRGGSTSNRKIRENHFGFGEAAQSHRGFRLADDKALSAAQINKPSNPLLLASSNSHPKFAWCSAATSLGSAVERTRFRRTRAARSSEAASLEGWRPDHAKVDGVRGIIHIGP